MGDVAMTEYMDLRARKPAAVDDAGVVQLVGDDVVLRAKDRRDGSRVGRESGLKNNASLDVLEVCNAPFKVIMQAHRPGDGSHGAGARAIASGRVDRRFDQL